MLIKYFFKKDIKMEQTLKNEMKQAIIKIAEKVNALNEPEHYQETNIFKILRLENYEIRHAAFLEFLMDPERNVELAHDFIYIWLDKIINHLGIEGDNALNKLFDGEEFEVNPIKNEHRYREIQAGKKQRIDHALELKIGKTRRVLVFEYKLNGVTENDFIAYKTAIEARYKGSQYTPYYFILELGSKIHHDENKGGFQFISKSTLVDTIRETLSIACQRDMMSIRLYLEQYLEILEPKVDEQFLFADLEKYLWRAWNPKIEQYEHAEEYFNKCVESYIEDEVHSQALYSYHHTDLYNRAAMNILQKHQIPTRLNSGWLRIFPYYQDKNFYLWTDLWDIDGQLFLSIGLEVVQPKTMSDKQAKVQQNFLIKIIQESKLFTTLHSYNHLDEYKEIWVNQDNEVVKDKLYHSNSTKIYNSTVRYLHQVSFDELEAICTLKTYPQTFIDFLAELIELIELINQNSSQSI